MLNVNTFDIAAAYATPSDDAPAGRVVGQDGNAVLLQTRHGIAVVSRPRADGDIRDVFPDAVDAPYIPLGWAFGA